MARKRGRWLGSSHRDEEMARFAHIVVLAGIGLATLGVPECSWGQQVQPHDAPSLQHALAQGVDRLKAHQPDSAIARLRPVVAADPTYRSPSHGTAAYWLGQAYEATGQVDQALDAWNAGVEALDDEGAFDLPLTDAFIQHVFERQDGRYYEPASFAYLRMLEWLDTAELSEREQSLIDRHLRALLPILSPPAQQQLGLVGTSDAAVPWPLPDGLGRQLVDWWAQHDPLPSTHVNERVEEHLERAVYAWAHYQKKGQLDDRGRIYIRFGPPYKKTDIDFDGARFRQDVLRRMPTITQSDFSKGEFWVYRQIDWRVHYLFVEVRSHYYKIGETSDLIPSALTTGMIPSQRGHRKAAAYVRSMVEAYRQLALYHESYSVRYQDLANYAGLLDRVEFTGQWPSSGDPKPATFAQSMRSRVKTEDERNARRRKEAAPRIFSNVTGELEPFPASARLTRFLDPDGTTRTEIYWSAPTRALIPSERTLERLDKSQEEIPNQYLVAVSVTQRATGARERKVLYKRYVMGNVEGSVIDPRIYTVRRDTGTYHVALQWEEYTTLPSDEGTPLRLGRRIKVNTFRQDSLAALQPDERVLEMSDLKPLYLPATDTAAATLSPDTPPYPFAEITPKTNLGLYFEVYHLGTGPEDSTRYSVEYDVWRRTERGGLTRLFQGEDARRTTTKATYQGDRRRTDEYLALNLSTWKMDDPGELRVTVRVTDETTGQHVERSIDFQFVPAPAESPVAQ